MYVITGKVFFKTGVANMMSAGARSPARTTWADGGLVLTIALT